MEHIDYLAYSKVNNICLQFSFIPKITNLYHFFMTLRNKLSPLLDKVNFQQQSNTLCILILVFSKILVHPPPTPSNPACSSETGRNIFSQPKETIMVLQATYLDSLRQESVQCYFSVMTAEQCTVLFAFMCFEKKFWDIIWKCKTMHLQYL